MTRGAQIGPYVIVREIGRGATGTVYEAERVELGKRVALKAMHAHLAQDAKASSRFLREGRAAAQIRSRHAVDVFDVGVHEGRPYLVMELLDGVDLAALLEKRGMLPLRELADLMLPIAWAVHVAHEAGVIHRDLKPSNVLLAKRERGEIAPTIVDFGISKVATESDNAPTASDVLLGTVHYMSPEQTRGSSNASRKSDQYALGVMLYECATGVRPFAGGTPYSLMHAIVSARVTPPSELQPSLPPELDAVILRAMHRDPGARFESVRALGAALLPWASEDARRQWARELGSLPPPPVVARRRVRARPVAFGIALVTVVLAAWLGLRARSSSAPSAPSAPSAASAPSAPSAPVAASSPAVPAEAPTAQTATRSTTVTPAPTTPASSAIAPDSPAESAVAARAASDAKRPRPAATPAPAARPAPAPPPAQGSAERGTNGALIVE